MSEREVGELVALRDGNGEGELMLAAVLATGDDGALQVAPLTRETSEAAEWDLILDPEDGPLGYAVIAEVWNHGRVNSAQLAESLGALEPVPRERLLALYEALRADGAGPEVGTGPSLLAESDPRLLFQEAEGLRARRYWSDSEDPALPAGEEAGFGPRLSDWLEGTGTDPSDLATDLGWSKPDLICVLHDEIQPLAPAHSVDRISQLILATDIEAEEAEQLLPDSVIWSAFPAETGLPDQEVAIRRAPASVERRLQDRRGKGGSERHEPTQAQRTALEIYVREIVSLVEEGRS
ncbi:MAG: hypothetical protein WD810_02920 [Solirubrobacterales bacterium]